jgi:glycosyltransferase involved in cell wall biosynthesis
MGSKEGTLSSSSTSNNSISLVIPVLNEAAHLERTISQAAATLPSRGEILVVDDGSSDGSAELAEGFGSPVRLIKGAGVGCAAARNLGGQRAGGEVIVFSDAHVEMPSGWWQPLVETLQGRWVGAVSPAIADLGDWRACGYGMRVTGPNLHMQWMQRRGREDYPVPALGSGFMAVRKEVFLRVGGFDEKLIRWGGNDLEMSLRLWTMGYELRVVPTIKVAHLFRKKPPYSVRWTEVLHNLLRIALIHFNAERISRVVDTFKRHSGFSTALALCLQGDALTRRTALAARRIWDDNWYFDSFGLNC